MIEKILARKKVTAEASLVNEVAKRCRANARQATQTLSFIFDLLAIAHSTSLSKEVISRAFLQLGVDEKGLLKRDHKYLAALRHTPLGLHYLQSVTGIDAKTIEDEESHS